MPVLKPITKGMRFADKLIAKAKKERDKKGYRENLGYDSFNELSDYLDSVKYLDLHDRWKVESHFYNECDKI